MSDAIVWPGEMLAPRDVSVDIAVRSISGPVAASGFSQVISSDAGLWKVTFGTVAIFGARKKDQTKTWRAIAGMAEGRLNPILLPICMAGYRPLPEGVSDRDVKTDIPHSDDTFFSDGTGYLTTYTNVVTSGSAAVRATTLSLIKIVSADLEPGMRFSIGERLYQILRVTAQDEDSATITIRPPLREFVEAGAQLEFDRPVLRVRLASDQEMDLPLEYGRWSFPSVSFIEDL